MSVGEGEPATLHCQYVGMPYPLTTVTWLRDNSPVRTDSHTYVSHNGTLHFHSTEASDRGEYVCVVNTTAVPNVYSEPATLHIRGEQLVSIKLEFTSHICL